jgi:hypothetical protein
MTLSDPAWTVFDRTSGSSETTDGDIRTYISPTVANANSYEFTGSSWTGAGTARTVEARIRVADDATVSQATDGQGSLILGVNDAAYDFRFFDGFIAYNTSSGGLSSVVTLDTTVFHTYRVTVDQSATPVVSLYIDGDQTPAFTSSSSWFTSAGFDKLVYGDISQGGESGSLDVDYISWASGVQTQVPEPSALALTSLAAAALLRRRRRQQ